MIGSFFHSVSIKVVVLFQHVVIFSVVMLVITGGAEGADHLAALVANEHGIPLRIVVGPSHPLARRGSIPSRQYSVLTPQDMEEALPYVQDASEMLQKTVKKPYTLELLMRNYHIVRDADCVYAFGKRLGEHVEGGTGWSVALALLLDKRVFVYDVAFNRWYKYSSHHAPQLLPTESRFSLHPQKTAIVGKRDLALYPRAQDALRQLFDIPRAKE